jgi:hypothetical protein
MYWGEQTFLDCRRDGRVVGVLGQHGLFGQGQVLVLASVVLMNGSQSRMHTKIGAFSTYKLFEDHGRLCIEFKLLLR